MNAFLIAFSGLQTVAAAPIWAILILKLTAILFVAWSIYFVLKQVNPRWRILLWRVTASGLIVLFLATWMFPTLKIRILQPPSVEETVAVVSEATTKVEKKSTVSDATGAPQSDRGDTMYGPVGFPGERFDRFPGNMPDLPAEGFVSATNEKSSELDTAKVPAPTTESDSLAKTVPPVGPETSEPASSTVLTWLHLLLVVWFVGIVLLGLRVLLGHFCISALVRRAKPVAPWIREESLRVSELIGCRHDVEVLQSPEVVSPFLFGVRRPRLLLPEKMNESSYRTDIPGILAHELTHVQHHDIAWNISLQLLSIVLWFHPLVWRMRKAHLAACELVSDAASAQFVGNVSDYCRILARVAVDACGTLPSTGMAMARTSAIIHRLNVLRKHVFHTPLRRRSVISFGLTTLLSVTLLGVLQLAFAEPTEETTPGDVAAASSDESVSPLPLKATLPDGTTVEILGLSEHPSSDKRWWKPDGTPLEKPLYGAGKFCSHVYPGKNEVSREVAYRITEAEGSGIWLATCFKRVGSTAGTMSLSALDGSGPLKAKAMAVRKDQLTFSAGVEYALGEWITHHTTQKGGDAVSSNIETGGFLVSPATEEKGSATLSVTHEMRDHQVRVVAVDLDGTRHTVGRQRAQGVGQNLNRITATFTGLPLSDVKEFRIESRPKKWIDLGEIALYPKPTLNNSLKAEVIQAVAKPGTPSVELPNVAFDLNILTVSRDSKVAKEFPFGHQVMDKAKYEKMVEDALNDKRSSLLTMPQIQAKLGDEALWCDGNFVCQVRPKATEEKETLDLLIKPYVVKPADLEKFRKSPKDWKPCVSLNVKLKQDEVIAFGGWGNGIDKDKIIILFPSASVVRR